MIQVVAVLLATAMLAACSREKIDWKSAEAADTVESYDHFLDRHPDGELATQARARVAQLNEDRDWKRAAAADTVDAYKQFLTQHESGKWAGEARIRVENFALDGTAMGPARPVADAEPAGGSSGAAVAEPKPAQVAVAHPAASVANAPNPAAAKPVAAKPAAAAAPTPAKPAPHIAAAGSSSPPPSAATPASAAAAAGQFGIQLGAFRSQDAALADWKRLQARFDSDLHGLFAKAVPVQQASGQLFRLQAPVGEETRARAICASLSRQSQPCVVVLPPSH